MQQGEREGWLLWVEGIMEPVGGEREKERETEVLSSSIKKVNKVDNLRQPARELQG